MGPFAACGLLVFRPFSLALCSLSDTFESPFPIRFLRCVNLGRHEVPYPLPPEYGFSVRSFSYFMVLIPSQFCHFPSPPPDSGCTTGLFTTLIGSLSCTVPFTLFYTTGLSFFTCLQQSPSSLPNRDAIILFLNHSTDLTS